jgi:serine/threonine protein kinase
VLQSGGLPSTGNGEKSELAQPGAALVGAVLQDTYRLDRLIAAGSMGAVYEGQHLRLGKRVAVKVMVRELVASRDSLKRFRREAEVTSRIGHPHIVNVFDFGEAPGGEPYLVMEYLEGEALDQRIERLGRLPLEMTVHVVKQTAAALAAAHAQGIVHRDLKPANVLLLKLAGEEDFVKVVDFGISKVKAATTRITRSSMAIGTPDYMSPEQAGGSPDEVDHWSDQWALAAMTYRMLCGQAPFAAEDVRALLYQVSQLDPPALSSRADVSPAVEAVVMRGLAKRAGDRFPSITAFARALEDAMSGKAAPVAPRPSPPRSTVVYGARPAPAPDSQPAPQAVPHPVPPEESEELVVPTTSSARTAWAIALGVALLIVAALLLR